VSFSCPYPPDVEDAMRTLYRSLRENDRRRYAAVEAAKLGHGGLAYISSLLDCDPKTIRQGREDLRGLAAQDPEQLGPATRVRKTAAGARPP
jgi:hypothetical protein